jgi:hypothetical protein
MTPHPTRPRRQGRLPTLLLAALALLVAGPAEAFRCGSRLVSRGDPQAKVRNFCGDPAGMQERIIYRSGRTRAPITSELPPGVGDRNEVVAYDRSLVEVVVEEWTYNLGPRKLMRLVRFENGFVTEVKTLGYGYTE